MNNYIETFFSEKAIPYKEFEFDVDGDIHMIDNEVVIEFIKNDKANHPYYKHVLRHMDILNSDINHFLEYVAKGIVTGGKKTESQKFKNWMQGA